MKAIIKPEARYVTGGIMTLDKMCEHLNKVCGLSRKEAEEHINILCREGFCVRDGDGFRMLAAMPVINSMR